jgi:hypothetical protein
MLIGLIGKAGSGKDTVADYLCDHHRFFQLSFADPLKLVVSELFDMPLEKLNRQELKELEDERYGFSPRWILQHLGTDVLRKLYPGIWVDHLIRRYQKYCDSWMKIPGKRSLSDIRVVVSDARFLNEATAIRGIGGQIWRVVCRNNPKDLKDGANHPSEVEQEQIAADCMLTAEFGDLKSLYRQAEAQFRVLRSQ